MAVFWYNGEYIPLNTPVFTVLSRNVNYADGIFETLRVKNKKICYWDFHFERLQKGIQVLHLNPADGILNNKTLLQNLILDLVERNKVKNNVKIKIQVYRGEETGAVLPTSNDVKTFIFCAETLPDTYELHAKEVIVYPDVALQYSVLSPLKTLNRLPYILAGIYAQKNNVQDAILLNTRQELAETTHSNIFYIVDNELYTSPLSSGCLDGVMRKIILKHFKVKEIALSINDVKKAESLFCTNVIQGINPIFSIKGIDKIFDISHFLLREIFEFLNVSDIK